MSNTGLNIECNLFYDTDASQWNFDENISKNDYLDMYIYTNFNNLGYFLKNKWNRSDIKNIYDGIDLNDLYTFENNREDKIKLIKFLKREFGAYYSDLKDMDVTEILEYYLSNNDLGELHEIIDCSGITYKKHYGIIEVVGYSQGDYAEVLILTDYLKEIWGSDKIDMNSVKGEIEHYFYDTPLFAQCEINGEEYIAETMDGYYVEFDKEDFITDIVDQFDGDKKLLKDELESIVPTDIDYN